MANLIASALYEIARLYIKSYRGASQNMSKNGEGNLLRLLETENIEIIFDVGANIGGWTKLARSHFPTADIHAFELSASTFSALLDNVQGLNISACNVGLSRTSDVIEYKDYGVNSGFNSVLKDLDFHDKRILPTLCRGNVVRGDEYAFEQGIDRIDLVKIDVEGAESWVLDGFGKLLSEGRIRVIQFEYGYANGDAHFLMKDFYGLLESCGYLIGPLRPKGVVFCPFEYRLNDFDSGPNYVAVHKSQRAIIERLEQKN